MKATALTGLSRVTIGNTRRTTSGLAMALALAAGTLVTAPAAEARITSIVIDCARSQSPTFGTARSADVGSVGQYEKLRGTAFGELDPLIRTTPSSPTSSSRRATHAARSSTRWTSSS